MKKAFTLIELLIVVAIIAILAAIAVPNFLEAQTRAKVSRVMSDQRTYATGLETYMIDNNAYPMHYPLTVIAGGATHPTNNAPTANYNNRVLTQAGNTAEAAKWTGTGDGWPTFATTPQAGAVIGLTTPISYLNTYVIDAFANNKQVTFAYATGAAGYLVWSPGPDGTDSLDQSQNAERILNAGQSLPSPYLIAGPQNVTPAPTGAGGTRAHTYDATNGTASEGDVYRTK